jgi:surfeit locus 1 family protein
MKKSKLLMTVFYLLLFPSLLSLAIWQWHRYQYKLQLQQKHTETQQAGLYKLTASNINNINLFQYVKVTGKYLKNKNFLLDNQIFHKQYGYSLITPFITTENTLLFVNRGWVKFDANYADFEYINDSNFSISGMVYQPLKKAFLLKEDIWQSSWPKVIQAIDINKMSNQFNISCFPFIIILNDKQPGICEFQAFNLPIKPLMHLGYCIQWLLMAITLTILYIIFLRKS